MNLLKIDSLKESMIRRIFLKRSSKGSNNPLKGLNP